ncbi:hypothetical protein GCK32_019241 [Trichostrongylus colubriformis]|uniref:Uncharacterized protein n=1 Tax=Trichostrongylus colubriformis TaxID=6319 RepID=A0AAN8FVI7_TRICO
MSHYAVRFYDLRIHVGNNYITPYLDLLAEPSLKYVFPHAGLRIIEATKANMSRSFDMLLSKASPIQDCTMSFHCRCVSSKRLEYSNLGFHLPT